jgi:outer membrane protein OmpA-like peptidoglycan-associated protein
MKQSLPIAAIALGSLLAGGCATKKYVNQSISPVNGRVDQLSQQSNQQGQKIDQTAANLEKTDTELSATKERAMTADSKAGDAINRADQAGQKADQAGQKADQANQRVDQVGKDLGDLRGVVANLDDYKQVAQSMVNFKFNSDRLDADAKQQLDQMAAGQGQYKRYFVAVEGFTDSVGSADYNNALSRRRADAVVQYLVSQHNIPIYRIHMIGLGKDKPIDDAKTRAARAKNRRVEVSLFSADQGAVAMNGPARQATTDAARSGNAPAQQ